MKKVLFIAALFLFSCTSKDTQFCKCLEAGDALNNFSSELLQAEVDQAKADKLNALKKAKKEACADYQTMKGEEMLKRKKECTSAE
jgi:hypothetical protein